MLGRTNPAFLASHLSIFNSLAYRPNTALGLAFTAPLSEGSSTMKHLVVATLVVFASAAWSHKVTTDFPAGATPLTQGEIKSAIEGKEFTAQPQHGPSWRLAYREDGTFTVSAGDFADEGKWSAGESAVCTEGKKLKYLCNTVWAKDGKLFLQRKDREVMQLIPK